MTEGSNFSWSTTQNWKFSEAKLLYSLSTDSRSCRKSKDHRKIQSILAKLLALSSCYSLSVIQLQSKPHSQRLRHQVSPTTLSYKSQKILKQLPRIRLRSRSRTYATVWYVRYSRRHSRGRRHPLTTERQKLRTWANHLQTIMSILAGSTNRKSAWTCNHGGHAMPKTNLEATGMCLSRSLYY